MGKNNIKDNILRQCYYHQDRGVDAVELRNFLMNDGLVEECCEELIKDKHLTKQDLAKKDFFFITTKGIEFALSSSYSCPNMPIVCF